MTNRPLDTSRRLTELEQLVETHVGTIKTLLDQQAQSTAMIQALHGALMDPQPGYPDSLLERVAKVTLAVETGNAVGNKMIWLAKVVGAISVIAGALYTFTHFGDTPTRMP